MRLSPCHTRGLAFALLAIAIALGGNFASATEDTRTGLAASLLKKAQTPDAIAAWRTMLLAPGALPDCGCGPEGQDKMDAAWRTAVDTTFDAPAVLAKMQQVFANAFSVEELTQMLAFRDSPLGRRVSALESAQSTLPGGEERILAEIGAMRSELSRNPARRRLLEDITIALGGVDAQVDVLLNVSLGTAIGVGAATPDGRGRLTQEEIIAKVEAKRADLRKLLAPMVLYNNASIYKSLRIDELRKYHHVLASELGRKSSRVVAAAFSEVLRDQALAIGVRFAKELDALQL